MMVVGIIAEYNPFHIGHQWQIAEVRRRLGVDVAVIAAMSGNWVQRGDTAVLEKHSRAASAVRGGADLVLEIPLTWATASAERFAQGGVGVLAATGIVDTLVFGSESGDLAALQRTADYLQSPAYSAALRTALKTGCSFAAARQRALDAAPELPHWDTRTRPNDQLALEYLKALQGTGICPMALPRCGAMHDGVVQSGIASAAQIRSLLRDGENVSEWLPAGETIRPEETAFLERNARGVLTRLRAMTVADFRALPDCGEGLEHRMVQAAREGRSVEEVCKLAKTKRYAYARIRRLVVRSLLGMTEEDLAAELPYLRVLAVNARGRELLHAMKRNASLPILTRPAEVRRLGVGAVQCMELEARGTDLWQLCLVEPGPGGLEWKTGVRIV